MPNIYDLPLRDRFERAERQFAQTYLRKARLDRAGVRPYTDVEFRQDLYGAAGDNGLFVESLWVYFRMLH